jgi:nucleotide-binding universal stress UspA family protein
MFTRILVPTDFSEPSDAALDFARALAGKFGATLHLLHVIEPDYQTAGAFTVEAGIGASQGPYQQMLADARARFAHRVTPADRTRYGATTEVIYGKSAETIVDFAGGQNIDLIVMGTHGRTGLAHLLMGSVAEHVVRTAPCPVLTVRQAPEPEAVTVSRSAGISQFDIVPGLG